MKQLLKTLVWAIISVCIGGLCMTSCEKAEKATADLSVSTEELNFPALASSQTFTLTSSTEWVIEHDDWIEIDTEYGEAGEDIPITVSVAALGSDEESLTGSIIISAGKAQQIIEVTQSNLGLESNYYNLEFRDEEAGATKNITITSTARWTSTADSWLKLDPKQGKAGKTKVKITASMNTEEGERSGTITLNAGGESGINQTITATQAKVVRLKVNDATIPDYYDENKKTLNSLSLSDKGNARKIKLIASSAWTTTSNNWVTITPSSGPAGVTKVSISADENNSTTEERTGEFTVTMNGVEPKVIPVTQGKKGDYYEDNSYIPIHQHTNTGITPIQVVLVGDGFDREDLKKGGFWEKVTREMGEMFLKMPIVRDYKDYFDVYALNAESKERGVLSGTKNKFGSGGPVDFDGIRRYINENTPNVNPRRTAVFIGNGMIGGYAMGDISVYSTDEGLSAYWTMHEYVGHIIGRMPDLYCNSPANSLNQAIKNDLDGYHKDDFGLGWMIDYTNDPEKVVWKEFLNEPQYEHIVGFFPGNYYGTCGDVFFPEEGNTSTMNGPTNYYLSPERYQLWKQIKLAAGEPYGFQEFFEFDKRYLDFYFQYDEDHNLLLNTNGRPKTKNRDYEALFNVPWPY